MCYRFMNLSSFQGLFGFHASEWLSKLNKMSPLTRSQSPFCVYKVKGINACKNHKLAKNGGPLHVRHADINGLREGWKADRKHRWVPSWVPSSLTVINCNQEASNMCSMTFSNFFDHPLMLCMECGIAKEH